MPIMHFINSKTQTAGGMKNVLAYVTRTEKTQSEDKQYVTALNCSASTAYNEMLATKNAYHKNSGRMYYHLVQSGIVKKCAVRKHPKSKIGMYQAT